MKSLHSFLTEGAEDPAIFKAVFLAGGPGSGKTFTVGKTALTALGFKVVNSDAAFEKAMQLAGLTMDPESVFSAQGQSIRDKAKSLTGKKKEIWLKGRLGLVIDGTGKDYDKIKKQKIELERLGYETAMIFVNTDLETALARDAKRDRTVGKDAVTKMWSGVQNNIGKFAGTFGNNMYIVDNSDGSDVDAGTTRVYRKIQSWSTSPPKNSQAQRWIRSYKLRKDIETKRGSAVKRLK